MINFPPKKVILVTGSNGQLGKEFRRIAEHQDTYEFLFTSRDTLNVTDADAVLNIFRKFRPDYCINCAAYTAVDNAEKEVELAYLVNSEAVSHVINGCSIYNCALIHYSTDYVYDSVVGSPINECDPQTPRGVYGKSKLAGELVLSKSNIDWICFRASWLYSSYNHNFLKTMIRLGKSKDAIHVVNDQIGAPTYARDLALDTIRIITHYDLKELTGFYNYSNAGTTHWAEYARKIFEYGELQCAVHAISTEAYGAPAPRPAWSVLDKTKAQQMLDIQLRGWKESLQECMDEPPIIELLNA